MMSFESAGIPIAKSETGQREEAVRNLYRRCDTVSARGYPSEPTDHTFLWVTGPLEHYILGPVAAKSAQMDIPLSVIGRRG